MAKKEKTALVKVNKDLYEAVRIIAGRNPIEYPTIKHFVEKAIAQAAGLKKYDIGGVNTIGNEQIRLHNVVGKPNGNFTFCMVCGRPFLKSRTESIENMRICPTCKETILHFGPKLKNSQEKSGGTKK